MNQVFQNSAILNNIYSFIPKNDVSNTFQYEPNVPNKVLIYGQVQSGKTAKIIDYIKHSKHNIPTILCIQNSLTMLDQYHSAFARNGVKVYIINNPNTFYILRQLRLGNNIVMLFMNNTYRKFILEDIIKSANLKRYILIMDESDSYHRQMNKTKLYNEATECVHVTATPFLKCYKNYFNQIISIQPKNEYFGLNKLDVKFVPDIEPNQYIPKIKDIIKNDFMKTKNGIILINVYNLIEQMDFLATQLYKDQLIEDIPIVTISSTSTLYYGGQLKELGRINVSRIISGLDSHKHIILIANRLSSRGINYSDEKYTRHLTYQITVKNNNITNFIQKCRILGNKVNQVDKPRLYCFNCDEEYFEKLLVRIDCMSNGSHSLLKTDLPTQ